MKRIPYPHRDEVVSDIDLPVKEEKYYDAFSASGLFAPRSQRLKRFGVEWSPNGQNVIYAWQFYKTSCDQIGGGLHIMELTETGDISSNEILGHTKIIVHKHTSAVSFTDNSEWFAVMYESDSSPGEKGISILKINRKPYTPQTNQQNNQVMSPFKNNLSPPINKTKK